MRLLAAYFMLTALVSPQFSEAGRIYRIASYPKETEGGAATLVWAAAVSALIFASGFFSSLARKMRKVRALPGTDGSRKISGETV
jgi:hypothetical protein